MLRQSEDGSLESIYRMPLEWMDRRDYIVEHAQALGSCGYAFDSALNEALEDGSVDTAIMPLLTGLRVKTRG